MVEGKAAGSSSLIIWDATGHSQMLDVTVDVNISRLRTAIEETYPGQPITVQSDGAHLILTGTVSDAKIVDDIGKLATLYSTGVVNSLVVAPVDERQILLEEMLSNLSGQDRDIYSLHLKGFSFAEIDKKLNLKPRTSEYHYREAQERLRKHHPPRS